MNCVIVGSGVKVFGKAIHALSRIGDELWLDPMVKGVSNTKCLALRSVNSAHSGYACFLFSPLFFQEYSMGSLPEQGAEAVQCKLVMKSVLPLFRCLTSIERNVERCQISVSTPSDRVIIQFFCRHGITKTHNIHFQDSEALQAVFAPHLCPNVLKAPARLLGDMVRHFPVFQEEITLSMSPLKVSLRNHYEERKGHVRMMHTEMSLHPDEFGFFQIGVDSDITFCLKELRGFLSFAESHSLPVSIHFDAAGKFADAAALHVDKCEGQSDIPHDVPHVMELVPSSQGSPIITSSDLMHLLPHNNNPTRLHVADEECASATVTPASSTICSLLFKALSSEHHDDEFSARLPVLACYSDDEETLEEDYPRSPRL
ncbi:cell cycle checkpoint control protein RAD9B isoform X3 [Melanotaenia boesemani]|uniref:cell cycle checkpoint control protein RAD9B isoform X3 n=1 Tax=Melanotaenia boesemani TaxID=1250792 RepID=UPI001C059CF7|nr:cell cycle checkpoint control protein RAD9B isoform X3 [Melanotaenia boesemani]